MCGILCHVVICARNLVATAVRILPFVDIKLSAYRSERPPTDTLVYPLALLSVKQESSGYSAALRVLGCTIGNMMARQARPGRMFYSNPFIAEKLPF